MIDFIELEQKTKKGQLDRCYVLCGMDEAVIKENIKYIEEKSLSKDFKDFNYIQFDGISASAEDIINSCETLPFMSDKKMVIVYRASFLEDGKGKKSSKAEKTEEEISEEQNEDNDEAPVKEEAISGKDTFKILSQYAANVPEHCILIMYYVMNNKRDKASQKVQKLSKIKGVCAVTAGKPRRDFIEKRAKALFEERGKNIGAIELKLFCQEIENKLNTMVNEVEKLCLYTDGRAITKEDIRLMMPPETDNDIFDFVDCLGDKNIEKAMDILNELIFKGQKIPVILRMVERQFNLLFNIKLGVSRGESKEALASRHSLHPFICGKMMEQSRKFSVSQLKAALMSCINAEEVLKSTSANSSVEMEMLIINSIINTK